jgi:hypothetical protein
MSSQGSLEADSTNKRSPNFLVPKSSKEVLKHAGVNCTSYCDHKELAAKKKRMEVITTRIGRDLKIN